MKNLLSVIYRTAILSVFLLSSCASAPTKPPEAKTPDGSWPEKPKSTGTSCPDISGIYYDIAVDSYSDYYPNNYSKFDPNAPSSGDLDRESSKAKINVCKFLPVAGSNNYRVYDICSLSNWLDVSLEHDPSADPSIDLCPLKTVVIEQPDNDTIEVKKQVNGEISKEYLLTKERDFKCDGGKIIIKDISDVDPYGPYSYRIMIFKRDIFPAENNSLVSTLYYHSRGMAVFAPHYTNRNMWLRYRKVDDQDIKLKEMVTKCKE